MKRKLSLVTAILLAVALILTGCGGNNAPAPANGDAAKPAETIKLTFQTYGEQGTVTFQFIERLANKINKTSGGQLEVTALPVNSVVSASDIMDAVNQGTLDGAHVTLQYYAGQLPAAMFWTGMPAGMNEHEGMVWNVEGEGDALAQEVVEQGGFNNIQIKSMGTVSSEIFLHSKFPINSIDDIKSKKIRAAGMWGEVAAELGAIPVSVAGAEVYSAFERGVVDAMEWGSPGVNFPNGYHEVGKYMAVPGIHQGYSVQHLVINKDKWNALPESMKEVINTCCEAMWAEMWSFNALYDADAWVKYKALVEEGKLEITTMTKEDVAKINEAAEKVIAAKAAKDPLYDKVYQAQSKFLKHFRNYANDFSVK